VAFKAALNQAADKLGWPRVPQVLSDPAPAKAVADQSGVTFRCPHKLKQLLELTVEHAGPNSIVNPVTGPESAVFSTEYIRRPLVVNRRWQATDIIYTDGSCQDLPGRVLGAGICRPSDPTARHMVDPDGLGPSNTINRAE